MDDHEPDKKMSNQDGGPYHPRVAVALLGVTALISIAGIIINLGRDALSAIAATIGVASALTLIAFQASKVGKK
jgi:hypothetical protein